MLNPKEAISKIKELLGLEFAEATQKFYTSQLEDGTTITNNTDSENLELGDTLYVVLEDGNLVPAPGDEDHKLQSGQVVRLDAESKVVAIMEDEEEVEEETPDEVEVVVEQKEIEEEEMTETENMSEDTELVSLKNEIKEMKEALKAVLDMFETFSSDTMEEFSKVNVDIENLRKEPEVENIKNKTKNNKLIVDNFSNYRVQQLKKYLN